MVQGVDLEDKFPPVPPKSPQRSIPAITIEAASGLLMLYFAGDLGEVGVQIQQLTGEMIYNQAVDTSVQDQASFVIPAGTYILTITDTAGDVIGQESILVP